MMQMDVSKCFDSIYTHSLSWALIGKQATKDNTRGSEKTFGGKFDNLMREMNDAESNGIIIGPEFSRIFAELILQSVDAAVELKLRDRPHCLEHKRDYDIFRYVDDYFIFYNREEDRKLITEVLTKYLSEVKLAVNTSKTALYQKPIITEITVAKDRISTLCNEQLNGRLEALDGLSDKNGGAVYSYSIDINANRLIIKFKTALKETGVAYKDILNYSFSIIENKLESILKGFCAAAVEHRSNKQLTKALVAIVEFVFFLYAASPRVNHTIRTCRIVSTISSFLESNALGAELKHSVYKFLHDNIVHHIKKHKVTEFREVESLYLLISLAELGRDYRLGESELADYFGFVRDGVEYKLSKNCELSHFSITVGLLYMEHKVRYAALRRAFEAYAVARIEERKSYCRRDAEMLLLTLDLISCPYIAQGTKDAIGKVYGLDSVAQGRVAAANHQWFTTWTDFDLQKELDAKRSREVY